MSEPINKDCNNLVRNPGIETKKQWYLDTKEFHMCIFCINKYYNWDSKIT